MREVRDNMVIGEAERLSTLLLPVNPRGPPTVYLSTTMFAIAFPVVTMPSSLTFRHGHPKSTACWVVGATISSVSCHVPPWMLKKKRKALASQQSLTSFVALNRERCFPPGMPLESHATCRVPFSETRPASKRRQ